MSDDEDVELLNEDTGDDDQVFFLYDQLMNQPYGNVDVVVRIEKSLYAEMAKDPEDNLAMLAFLQAETMLGNRAKAKALAYKIWEVGSQLDETEEYIYINNLLNLGFLEMASVLLKPKFEALTANIEFFYPLLLKLSTMTGNVYLLERLISHPNAPEVDDIYMSVINRYKNYNYVEHFKNVQKLIAESVKDILCTYDYDVINNSLSDEIEIQLFAAGDENTLKQARQILQEKLQTYYQSVNIDRLACFSWEIFPISSHSDAGLS